MGGGKTSTGKKVEKKPGQKKKWTGEGGGELVWTGGSKNVKWVSTKGPTNHRCVQSLVPVVGLKLNEQEQGKLTRTSQR